MRMARYCEAYFCGYGAASCGDDSQLFWSDLLTATVTILVKMTCCTPRGSARSKGLKKTFGKYYTYTLSKAFFLVNQKQEADLCTHICPTNFVHQLRVGAHIVAQNNEASPDRLL